MPEFGTVDCIRMDCCSSMGCHLVENLLLRVSYLMNLHRLSDSCSLRMIEGRLYDLHLNLHWCCLLEEIDEMIHDF